MRSYEVTFYFDGTATVTLKAKSQAEALQESRRIFNSQFKLVDSEAITFEIENTEQTGVYKC